MADPTPMYVCRNDQIDTTHESAPFPELGAYRVYVAIARNLVRQRPVRVTLLYKWRRDTSMRRSDGRVTNGETRPFA